jgi:hypothetical protein
MMYIAQIRAKNGSLLLEGEPRDTREAAARFVFRARESAPQCSTQHAYRDPSGNWRTVGGDVRWHKRRDILPDVPKPCDVGLFGDAKTQLDLVEMANGATVGPR